MYLWPKMLLLYSKAFWTSSWDASSTKASPLGRPSRWLIAKWIPFSPSTTQQSLRKSRMSLLVEFHGKPRSLMIFRSSFMSLIILQMIERSRWSNKENAAKAEFVKVTSQCFVLGFVYAPLSTDALDEQSPDAPRFFTFKLILAIRVRSESFLVLLHKCSWEHWFSDSNILLTRALNQKNKFSRTNNNKTYFSYFLFKIESSLIAFMFILTVNCFFTDLVHFNYFYLRNTVLKSTFCKFVAAILVSVVNLLYSSLTLSCIPFGLWWKRVKWQKSENHQQNNWKTMETPAENEDDVFCERVINELDKVLKNPQAAVWVSIIWKISLQREICDKLILINLTFMSDLSTYSAFQADIRSDPSSI